MLSNFQVLMLNGFEGIYFLLLVRIYYLLEIGEKFVIVFSHNLWFIYGSLGCFISSSDLPVRLTVLEL